MQLRAAGAVGALTGPFECKYLEAISDSDGCTNTLGAIAAFVDSSIALWLARFMPSVVLFSLLFFFSLPRFAADLGFCTLALLGGERTVAC